MLYPKQTNCSCAENGNIDSLISSIDCRLSKLANTMYNNTVFMLNKTISGTEMFDLIQYKRILYYKQINPDYVDCYSVNQIASQVKRFTANCTGNCNDSNIFPAPPIRTTTTTSSTSTTTSSSTTTTTTIPPSTNYNVIGCETSEEHVITYIGGGLLFGGDIVSNNNSECWFILDETTSPADVGTVDTIYDSFECELCINSNTTTTTTTMAPPPTTTTTTTTEIVSYVYRIGKFTCGTCEPSGSNLRANAGPLNVGQFYYDDFSGEIIAILEFITTSNIPTPFNINIATEQSTCEAIVCPTTTTTTTITPTTTTTTIAPTTTSTSTTSTTSTSSTTTTTTTICCQVADAFIGAQTWTGCNATVATYSDGTPIPQVSDPTAWQFLTTGAWCYYDNDPATECVYGKLYNWFAVAGVYDSASNANPALRKQFAPAGYHVPTQLEFNTLISTLGGSGIAGQALKEAGTTHWITNTGATNSSGFTALPGGNRTPDTFGTFYYKGSTGNFWSVTTSGPFDAYFLLIFGNTNNVSVYSDERNFGRSVRFVKNNN